MATERELERLKRRQAQVLQGVRAYQQRHKEAGLCPYCFDPPVAGKHACERHLDEKREHAPVYLEQLARDEAKLRMLPYSRRVR